MPAIKITTTAECQFRDQKHLETIINTAREGARQTTINILMLQPSGTKSQPRVKMMVEQIGQEDRAYDILDDLRATTIAALSEEDPFA